MCQSLCCPAWSSTDVGIRLTFSVLGRIFILILLIISRFATASETHVGIKMVKNVAINLLALQQNCLVTPKPLSKIVSWY